MIDAAVGFQCPSCIAEGRKSTRSGRTAYGGLRSGNPGLTSIILIAINAAVWLAILATGGAASRLVDLLALRPNGLCIAGNQFAGTSEATCGGATWLPGVDDGAYWQLFTSAFLHVEVWHIGFNMLALWFLGPQLEQAIGRWRFLALYLLSALAGSVLVYWASPEFQATLGASGAIFGLMGGLVVVAFKVHGDVRGILVWVGINAIFTLTVPNVSWQGHLGGFLGGALVAAILVYAPRQNRTLWQMLGMGALAVGLVVAILARSAVLT